MLAKVSFFKPESDKFIIVSSRLGANCSVQMLSRDAQFLREKWEIVTKYTKNADPNAPVGDLVIQEITEGEYKGWAAVQLDKILPRLVCLHYGEVFMQGPHRGNCHGSALMAAGVFPAMSCMDPIHTVWRNCITSLKNVALDDLSCGDIVYVGGTSHSFIYLDPDLSLSKNGAGSKLALYPTSVVLETYGCPKDVLSKPELAKEKNVSVLRKRGVVPEHILQMVIEYYQIVISDPAEMPAPGETNYDCLKEIALSINEHFKREPKVIWQDLLVALGLTPFLKEDDVIQPGPSP